MGTQANTESLRKELEWIWQKQTAAGLVGKMSVYSLSKQQPWRSEEMGLNYWFGPDEIDDAITHIQKHYNNGKLPNTTLLLNPVVHHVEGEEAEPLGTAILWNTVFSLGVDEIKQEQLQRMHSLGLMATPFNRSEDGFAGIKVLGYSDQPIPVKPQDALLPNLKAIYNLLDQTSEQYFPYYALSGLNYLCTHGMFTQTNFDDVLQSNPSAQAVKTQDILDASTCWDAYDKHHSLYEKFGTNTADIPENLRFYELCARDISLFDATGTERTGSDQEFEFLVPGWLPRGGITLMAGTGGTGKSSLAHLLCVQSAIDYRPDEAAPTWLGKQIDLSKADGMCIYFSGEDGPAIINARADLYDPERRADRLMFLRNDFGDDMSFSDYMRSLHKLPNVSLLVIDPARKYIVGDEDNAQVVSDFFEAIEEFTIEKKCATIVVHHLQKGAAPEHVAQIRDQLRGSQVFIDRPRVVIGMYRDGPYTIVGLSKNNIPTSLGMVQGEHVFARDPEKLQLVQLPGDAGIRNAEMSHEDIEKLQAQQKPSA